MSAAEWIALSNVGVTLLLAILAGFYALAKRNADGTSQRVEKHSDRQASHGETQARLDERVSGLETGFEKLADALQRIARLEEWRQISTPRLDDADATARAVVALNEQNRTVFKRMDQTDEKIDALSREQKDIPRQTAEMLRTMIRPIAGKAA